MCAERFLRPDLFTTAITLHYSLFRVLLLFKDSYRGKNGSAPPLSYMYVKSISLHSYFLLELATTFHRRFQNPQAKMDQFTPDQLMHIPLMPPPPGITSNFNDPPTRGKQTQIAIVVKLSFMIPLLILRIRTRLLYHKVSGLDDCMLVPCMR
jgi:hypothetical protein